jgi:hypothetical protein
MLIAVTNIIPDNVYTSNGPDVAVEPVSLRRTTFKVPTPGEAINVHPNAMISAGIPKDANIKV